MTPKISVFTSSHDPKFLDECYYSLRAQTFEDWEWVVYLNGRALWVCPEDDHRVIRRSHLGSKIKGVGHAKKEAVALCSGELLVELDHDDMLYPDALRIVWREYSNFPNNALYYSDFSHIDDKGYPVDNLFDPAHGWKQDGDKTYSFYPHPSAVSFIWYAPNHVRAFPRVAYDAVGGYDEDLDILDDQDLMNRLYRYGRFWYISQILYMQRVHSDQTQADPDKNQRIQSGTVEMYKNNIEANALAWAKHYGGRCLDMGGAFNKPEGYESVDLHPNADIVGDAVEVLRGMYDGEVAVIRCVDFLEHLRPEQVVPFMNECYRVLRNGGMMFTRTPSTDGRGAFQDPTHVSFWNENSFAYYTDQQFAQYIPEYTGRFMMPRLDTYFPSPWHAERNVPYVAADLVAVKSNLRLPGVLLI